MVLVWRITDDLQVTIVAFPFLAILAQENSSSDLIVSPHNFNDRVNSSKMRAFDACYCNRDVSQNA